MTRVRDLELAVVQAAMAEHRGCAPETCGGSRLDPCQLGNAIEALTLGCRECDTGRHVCPGDGNSIPHGATDCGEHTDPDAENLALLVEDTAHEWIKYVQWHDGSQVKIIWQNDLSARVVGDPGGQTIGEFEVFVSARRLPPLSPEDDGALRAELAATEDEIHPSPCGYPDVQPCICPREEPILVWVPRTWLDVRAGDDVRLPGTEATAHVEHAVHQRWHVDPRTGTASWNPPQPLEWSGVKVTLRTTANPDQPAELTMDPTKPVEIKLTKTEADAIEILGWETRIGMITEGAQ